MTDEIHFQSVAKLATLIRRHKVSPVELTTAFLERITALDPQLNAFITVTADDALMRAREADKEIASGNYRGPLHGIPISLKDLVDMAGVRRRRLVHGSPRVGVEHGDSAAATGRRQVPTVL